MKLPKYIPALHAMTQKLCWHSRYGIQERMFYKFKQGTAPCKSGPCKCLDLREDSGRNTSRPIYMTCLLLTNSYHTISTHLGIPSLKSNFILISLVPKTIHYCQNFSLCKVRERILSVKPKLIYKNNKCPEILTFNLVSFILFSLQNRIS